MYVLIFIAGILAFMATIGHLTVGVKLYLKPLLEVEMDEVAKKVMHTVFHYISVFMALSAMLLLIVGFRGKDCLYEPSMALSFVAYNYALFAIVQWIMVLRSGLKNGLFKMFQWVFWILISGLIFIHLY